MIRFDSCLNHVLIKFDLIQPKFQLNNSKMSHGLDRDSMVLSNHLNDFIAREGPGGKSQFLELDTHDWSELIQRFIEPDGYHRQTNSVGIGTSWPLDWTPIPTIQKKTNVS